MDRYSFTFLKDANGRLSPIKFVRLFFSFFIPLFFVVAIYDTYNSDYRYILLFAAMFGFAFKNLFLRIVYMALVAVSPFIYVYTEPYFHQDDENTLRIYEVE